MLAITEQLQHSTVRIDTLDVNGGASSGTGFFFHFETEVPGQVVPTIVTNKHVVRNQVRGFFHFTMENGDGGPNVGRHERIELLNFESNWIQHPDSDVDLAMCPIGAQFNQLTQMNKRPFFVGLDKSLIPTEAQLAELNAGDELLMIGYPNGLWDAKNNFPLVRRGVTASSPAVPYNGRPDFVIDAACFPGSSGSPVLVVNRGFVQDGRGNIHIGQSRVLLLGVLYAGPQFSTSGTIVVKAVPTALQPVPVVNMMMNLGFCVRASKIKDFEAILVASGYLRSATKLLAANDAA